MGLRRTQFLNEIRQIVDCVGVRVSGERSSRSSIKYRKLESVQVEGDKYGLRRRCHAPQFTFCRRACAIAVEPLYELSLAPVSSLLVSAHINQQRNHHSDIRLSIHICFSRECLSFGGGRHRQDRRGMSVSICVPPYRCAFSDSVPCAFIRIFMQTSPV